MSNPPSGGPPSRWIEEASEQQADCRVFEVRRRHFRHPERPAGDDFFVVESPDWVMALAQTVDGKWVLVRQFRFGSRELTWEFPSGCVEPGEAPLKAVCRELEEETGYVADAPVRLGSLKPNPAIMDNTCHFFYFPNARPTGRAAWDEHEEIEVATVGLTQIEEWAGDGTIVHSLVHSGLYLYRAWRGRQEPGIEHARAHTRQPEG